LLDVSIAYTEQLKLIFLMHAVACAATNQIDYGVGLLSPHAYADSRIYAFIVLGFHFRSTYRLS
jgi:hypothetical protein